MLPTDDATSDLARVALIGDAFVDIQVSGLQRLPAWSEDRDCTGVQMLPGGSCANVARQLASLGRGELAAVLSKGMADITALTRAESVAVMAPQHPVLVAVGDPLQQLLEVTHGKGLGQAPAPALLGVIIHQLFEVLVKILEH